MKRCQTCKQVLPLEAYGKNRSKKDGIQPFCRECGREKDRKHYATSAHRRQKIDAANRRVSLENREKLKHYVVAIGKCADCPETDPVVMDFDHVRGEKKYNISTMVRSGISWARVLTEIAKCEVVCANCHRRRTARRGEWYSDFEMPTPQRVNRAVIALVCHGVGQVDG